MVTDVKEDLKSLENCYEYQIAIFHGVNNLLFAPYVRNISIGIYSYSKLV